MLLSEAGKEYDIKPIGLGARDTLRLEKRFTCTEMTSTIPLHPLKPDWDGSQNLQREKILQTVRFSKNKKQKAPPASWYDLN